MLSAILPILALAAGAKSQQVTSQISQSGSYIPSYVECPSNTTFVRPASSGLSMKEETWLRTRKSVVTDALETYLNNVNLSDFDVQGYISTLRGNTSFVPTVAMTLSGGGQRAEFCGLALIQAIDARYQPALQAKTGGLLQAMTYQSGCTSYYGFFLAISRHLCGMADPSLAISVRRCPCYPWYRTQRLPDYPGASG